MSRARAPEDWELDLAEARPVERQVHAALGAHPAVTHLADFTGEMDALDFHFRFERGVVRVDVKGKKHRYSDEYSELWLETPRDELFILDETSFRTLVWEEGLGYLLVCDEPRGRWHVFGPWELCLGPRRRFERLGTKTYADDAEALDPRRCTRSSMGVGAHLRRAAPRRPVGAGRQCLGWVESHRQRAGTGTTAWVRWTATGETTAAWFEGEWPPIGVFVVATGTSAHGDHHAVSYVNAGHLLSVLPADTPAASEHHSRRQERRRRRTERRRAGGESAV